MKKKQNVAKEAVSIGDLNALAQAILDTANKANENEQIEFERTGKKITLPQGMDYETAIKHLQRKQKEEETPVAVREEIDAFPFDGAYMLMLVLKDRYGWASPVPTPGFFGPKPPVMVGLEIAPGEFTQIFWGGFAMPGIEGQLNTQMEFKDGRMIFLISGQVKKKHENEVREIADEVRKKLKTHSIYRGQAIRLSVDDEGNVVAETAPKFIDTRHINEEELILPLNVQEQVETSIYTPIEKTEVCRKHKVPLKMGILLEGPYGTGKTLTAYVTAKKCVRNNWTFIYLDRVAGLHSAIQFARQYMPSVIFSEDIDRIIEGEERTTDIDDVLNTVDGIESKGTEIMTVLTTNHVERINRAMLRPGRLDAVISIEKPDRAAAAKLIRIYAKGLVGADCLLAEASRELEGQIPAVIREVVERAKRNAIWRLQADEAFTLEDTDLAKAARSMKHHLELMNPKPQEVVTQEEQLGRSLGAIVNKVTSGKKPVRVSGSGIELEGYVED